MPEKTEVEFAVAPSEDPENSPGFCAWSVEFDTTWAEGWRSAIIQATHSHTLMKKCLKREEIPAGMGAN